MSTAEAGVSFKRLWDFLHRSDPVTWAGHFVLGFLITWGFSPTETFVAFVYHELTDIGGWWRSEDPEKRSFGEKGRDGFFDFVSAMAGAAVAVAFGL
jgi:hypothetical protein